MADTLAALAAELAAMPVRQRQAILARLTAMERQAMTKAAGQIEPGDEISAGDASAGFSPWLDERLRRACDPGHSEAMTSRTRDTLLRIVGDPADARRSSPGMAPGDPAGRSLVGAMSGLLSQRRNRR